MNNVDNVSNIEKIVMLKGDNVFIEITVGYHKEYKSLFFRSIIRREDGFTINSRFADNRNQLKSNLHKVINNFKKHYNAEVVNTVQY